MKTKLIRLLIIIAGLMSCSPETMYRNKLVPPNKSASLSNQYGAYIEATTNSSIIMGEYLTYSNDTLFILTLSTVERIPIASLAYINLVLTRTKAKNYLRVTGAAMLPSIIGAAANPEYAGEFLTIALVIGASGGLAALIESQRKALEVHYSSDQDQINKSVKYARFPKGFPDGLDPDVLIPKGKN
jgi:hypothetical protein